MDSTDSVIRLSGVERRFGRRATNVLDGVDLSIPRGSVVGLLGRNGSGKTTLIKCAMGLLRTDAGKARVFDEDAWDLSPEAKMRIGYVPQVVSLYPWMRVKQLIGYTASFYPTWNDDRVAHWLDEWQLDANARIGPLSVGQLQKLAIMLALGHEPELLVLDEPVASLDPHGRRSFLQTIIDRAMDGRSTVLFSTHITSDLERVADRVAILREGRIIYHDELDALKDSVKRLHITAARPLPRTLSLPGAVHEQIDGREAMVTVCSFDGEQVGALSQQLDAQVNVEDLNLEDIYLELHHDAAQPIG
jgi:ABC-2 type transport system ATP-binding protein